MFLIGMGDRAVKRGIVGVSSCLFFFVFVVLISHNVLANVSDCGSLSENEYCLYVRDYASQYSGMYPEVAGYKNYVEINGNRVSIVDCDYEDEYCNINVNNALKPLVLRQKLEFESVVVEVLSKFSGQDDILRFLVTRFKVSIVGAVDCVEDWGCGEWSECVDEKRTRVCVDGNGCGTTENKPLELESCDVGVSRCGDGVVSGGEECDDGGVVSGDGCARNCKLEKPVGVSAELIGVGKVKVKWKHYSGLFAGLNNDGTGGAVIDVVTGGAVSDVGFFGRVLNFFKWMFGMRVVGVSDGVQVGNNGYIVYRNGEDDGGNWNKVGFVEYGMCVGTECGYEDDGLAEGSYYYRVSVVAKSVEGEKSDAVLVRVSDSGDRDGENEYVPFLNPPIGIGNRLVETGRKLSINLNGEDKDGGSLVYGVRRLSLDKWEVVDSLPDGAQLDSNSGLFEWETSSEQTGGYLFNFTVSDGKFFDSEVVAVSVYGADTLKCDEEGMIVPYNACSEKKPSYCNSTLKKIVPNCADCGCPKSNDGRNLVCHVRGKCILPYDCVDADGDGIYAYDKDKCPLDVKEWGIIDCDDSDPNVSPYANEICGDKKDNNCDGVVDEAGCFGGSV